MKLTPMPSTRCLPASPPWRMEPSGFDGDGDDVRVALLEEAGDAGEGAAGADAADEGVDAAVELLPDFGGGGVVVELRVGLVGELAGHEAVGNGGGGLVGAADGSGHAFGFGCAGDLGAEAAHENAFFLGKAFGDEELDFVAAVDADERQADAGVAGGGLKNGAARMEQAAGFGVEDHSQCRAVFDGAAGVEEFELGENLRAGLGREPGQLEHWRVADKLGDVACRAALEKRVLEDRHGSEVYTAEGEIGCGVCRWKTGHCLVPRSGSYRRQHPEMQVLRLRLAQTARQTPLRMTAVCVKRFQRF